MLEKNLKKIESKKMRGSWNGIKPITKVVKNKKGKGSYTRKGRKGKNSFDLIFFFIFWFILIFFFFF